MAVLSDLHVGSPFNHLNHLKTAIDLTLKAKPDLILLAGDYVVHGVPGGQFVSPSRVGRASCEIVGTIGGVHRVGEPRLVA